MALRRTHSPWSEHIDGYGDAHIGAVEQLLYGAGKQLRGEGMAEPVAPVNLAGRVRGSALTAWFCVDAATFRSTASQVRSA